MRDILTHEQDLILAVEYQTTGHNVQAKTIYLSILLSHPDHPFVLHQLGLVAHQMKDHGEAIGFFLRAVAVKPDYTQAHYNLACEFKILKRFDEAVASYQRTLVLDPDYVNAHFNLGNVMVAMGQLGEALGCFESACVKDPGFVKAHYNHGKALHILGRFDESAASYSRVLAINPGLAEVHSDLIFTEHYRPGVTLRKLKEIHVAWDKQHGVPLKVEWQDHDNLPELEKRLRIGLVSADLGRHPVGYFAVNFLEHRPVGKTEIICYSDKEPDDFTDRLKTSSDEWVDTRGLSDVDLSQHIRSDRIDILIDLSGHTGNNRLLVFARKPAPVQVTWAGYMGTTGLSAIDYLIADYWQIPEGTEQYYSEELVYLPDGNISYAPPDYAPNVGALPFEKNGFVTFASFSNPAKCNEYVLGAWAKILKAVPNSRLILKYQNMDSMGIHDRIEVQFDAYGIERSRLIIEGRSPNFNLLSRYNDVDIALDTFPFSGGLTTCEALWMGVPVVTKMGETFASRHAFSHLMNVGVPELVANDLPNYITTAVELANNIPRLTKLRVELRCQMAKSALCDGTKFATVLTSALRKTWHQWCLLQ